jgi:hypothetical protein
VTTIIDDDLVVSGALSAANVIFGSVTITPEVNTPTKAEVRGLNHPDTNEPTVILSAHSAYPQVRVREVGYRFSNSDGFDAYIYRTSGVDTNVHWLSWQEAELE